MTSLLLDAGALIAVERGDDDVAAQLRAATDDGLDVRTTAMVIAQVWRGGGRQVLLTRLLSLVKVFAIDEDLGRRTGELLGAAGTSDAIDASLVLVAEDRDRILTSDADDIERLVQATGRRVLVTAC